MSLKDKIEQAKRMAGALANCTNEKTKNMYGIIVFSQI